MIDRRILLFVALWTTTVVAAAAVAEDSPNVPSWQTVVPDTGVVVALTGPSSPAWQLHSNDRKYNVEKGLSLPSDLLTNLMHAGVIDDPYLDRNFLTQRHVWMGDHAMDDQVHANRTRGWIYSTTFELPSPDALSSLASPDNNASRWTWFLVVEGIKMGAHIAINGVPLGNTTNQFLRYKFQVTDRHWMPSTGQPRRHKLTITFDPSIEVDGRFAACSGGWDWAPYTKSDDAQGKRSYTLGIVKPIYLVAVQSVAIEQVVPKIYYLGPYPRTPLTRPTSDFELQLEVHLSVNRDATMAENTPLVLLTPFHHVDVPIRLDDATITVTNNDKVVTTNITFRREDVDLWWPNGMGNQPLYDIQVGFADRKAMVRKRVGESFPQTRYVAIYC